ncbi:hypothetical protein RQP46_005438 [Phenoliferia psychrophenolica]
MSDSSNSILRYLDNRDSSVAALAGQQFGHHPQYAAGGSHPPGYNDFPGVQEDPFLSEQERMNRIVLTREERQEGYDANLAYSEPRGMAIGDIPRSAPRGFQLHDGPVSPSLSPGYTEDYSNRPQRFPSTSSHAPSHYTVHPPPSFINPDLHHESEFRYPAQLPATHDFGYAASPRHSTVSRSATLTSEHASLGEWNENEKAATVVPQGFYDNIEADFERAERKERRKKIAIWVGGVALLAIVLGVGIGVGVKNHHSTSSLADSVADGNATSSGKSSASASFAFLSETSTNSQDTTSSSETSAVTSSSEVDEQGLCRSQQYRAGRCHHSIIINYFTCTHANLGLDNRFSRGYFGKHDNSGCGRDDGRLGHLRGFRRDLHLATADTLTNTMSFATLKQLGNDAVRDKKWDVGVVHYTAALEIDSTSEAAAALYSNRCACYVPLYKFDLDIEAGRRAEDDAALRRYATAAGSFARKVFQVDAGGTAQLIHPGCLITHSDGMHFVTGHDPSHPIQVKVTDMIKFDADRFGYMQFLKPGALASDCVDHFDRRRLAEGWNEPRKALTAMVSGLLVGAILSCLQGDIGDGMIPLRYVSELVKAGIERWTPGEDSDRTCGPCFTLEFRRGVDVRLLFFLEQGFLGAKNELTRQAFQLREIDTRARELLEDLKANPILPEAGVPYTAFQVIATAVANKSRGLVMYTASESDEEKLSHSILHFKGMESSRAAGRFYLAAGRVLPEDSEDRPGCFYRALSMALRGGGITIREAFARGAEAEQAMIPPERIFGEGNRKFEDRTFVRIQLDAMRDWIESGQGLILNYTEADGVTRIPDPLDITIQPIPTLYMQDMPPSGNPSHIGLVDAMEKKPVGKPTPIRRGGAP